MSAAASSSASSHHSPFPPAVRETLLSWFSEYGTNPHFEIECRVKDVGAAGFERVLSALKSHKHWAKPPMPELSLDMMHATGVRQSIVYSASGPGPATFMRKQKGSDLTVSTPSGYDVRFQVATEQECAADQSPVHTYRHKERFSFVHKDIFRFDLTRVKQGTTDQAARQNETTYEVELEYCGHQTAHSAQTDYLADSLCMKVADLLQQLSHAPRSTDVSLTHKRQRTDGTLQEGAEIAIAEGTEIALEPSGHGVPPRYSGEMPAELVPRWLFSHFEAGGRAYIMSEPARIGEEHFPLFYFCGTVPAASVSPRPQPPQPQAR